MRKENEKSIKKKQMAEHMINYIDDKYIKQAADYKAKNNRNAESSGKARNAIYAEIVKVAIAACIIVALVLFIGRNNFNNNKNNKYKKFIKKYEKKINEMKNNQKLVDEFLEDYNKITEK